MHIRLVPLKHVGLLLMHGNSRRPLGLTMYRSPLSAPMAQNTAFPTTLTMRPGMRSIHLALPPAEHWMLEYTGPSSMDSNQIPPITVLAESLGHTSNSIDSRQAHRGNAPTASSVCELFTLCAFTSMTTVDGASPAVPTRELLLPEMSISTVNWRRSGNSGIS